MSIKIDTDVPFGTANSPVEEALRTLQVGHSFELPPGLKINTARTVASGMGKKLGRVFAWRGHRCWRVK